MSIVTNKVEIVGYDAVIDYVGFESAIDSEEAIEAEDKGHEMIWDKYYTKAVHNPFCGYCENLRKTYQKSFDI